MSKFKIIKKSKPPILKRFERVSNVLSDYKFNPMYFFRDDRTIDHAGTFIKSRLAGAILRRRLGVKIAKKRAEQDAREYDMYNRQAFVTLAFWGDNEGKSQEWKMNNIDKALQKKKRFRKEADEYTKRPYISYLIKWQYDPSVNYLIKLRL
jgi:hypothetical protein